MRYESVVAESEGEGVDCLSESLPENCDAGEAPIELGRACESVNGSFSSSRSSMRTCASDITTLSRELVRAESAARSGLLGGCWSPESGCDLVFVSVGDMLRASSALAVASDGDFSGCESSSDVSSLESVSVSLSSGTSVFLAPRTLERDQRRPLGRIAGKVLDRS